MRRLIKNIKAKTTLQPMFALGLALEESLSNNSLHIAVLCINFEISVRKKKYWDE